jgi:hypothetical protein
MDVHCYSECELEAKSLISRQSAENEFLYPVCTHSTRWFFLSVSSQTTNFFLYLMRCTGSKTSALLHKVSAIRPCTPWLRWLVAGLSPRMPGFAPGSIHVGFVVRVALGQVFLRVLRFFPCQYHSTVAL